MCFLLAEGTPTQHKTSLLSRPISQTMRGTLALTVCVCYVILSTKPLPAFANNAAYPSTTIYVARHLYGKLLDDIAVCCAIHDQSIRMYWRCPSTQRRYPAHVRQPSRREMLEFIDAWLRAHKQPPLRGPDNNNEFLRIGRRRRR